MDKTKTCTMNYKQPAVMIPLWLFRQGLLQLTACNHPPNERVVEEYVRVCGHSLGSRYTRTLQEEL